MSEVTMIGAFGPRSRWHAGPRQARVFVQQVVGGRGIYRFHNLTGPQPALTVSADDAALADVLMAGAALVDASLDLSGTAKEVVNDLLSGVTSGEVSLAAHEAALVAEAVAHYDVAGVVTWLGAVPLGNVGDFRGWNVVVTTAAHQENW